MRQIKLLFLLLGFSFAACSFNTSSSPPDGSTASDADGGQADAADAFDAGQDGGADAYDAGGDPADDGGAPGDGDGETDSGPDLPIDEALSAIEGMSVWDRGTSDGYRVFDLIYRLPVDHQNPGGQDFGLRMTLLHLAKDAPFVLVTTGYDNYIGSQQDGISWLLQANQLSVEYRYFGSSMPYPPDYDFLTIEQASADFHAIVTALRPIYPGPWISTGKSKGGMTVIHHRRFYPDDVDGTVAYVAPSLLGAPDTRYQDFFETVGETACREHVRALQREILNRRDNMLPLVESAGYSYTRIGGPLVAFESAVVESQFAFWQFRGRAGCDSLPTLATTHTNLFNNFLDATYALSLTSDSSLNYFGSWYYQARSQMGYPLVPEAHLADLLTVDVIHGEEGLPPEGTSPVYDPTAAQDIDDWVSTQGSRLMIVMGEDDPFTATPFQVDESLDSYLFIVPGGTHEATLSEMTTVDKATANDALTRWTGVDVNLP